MTTPFVQRELQFQFQVAGISATLPTGLRARVTISNAGGPMMNGAHIEIYGMERQLMNKLTTLGTPIWMGRADNVVTIQAGDVGTSLATVFTGMIYQAWAAPEGIPDVPFVCDAWAGGAQALIPVSPTSVKGPTDAATVMSGLANKMGLQFQNYGVQGIQVSNLYLHGTYLSQVERLAETAHINKNIDLGVLSIWPIGGNKGTNPIQVSPDHGMVGFPLWTAQGLIVTTLFNPSIVLGGQLDVLSNVIDQANATWSVTKVEHELETQLPNGKWFTRADLTVKGNFAPAV